MKRITKIIFIIIFLYIVLGYFRPDLLRLRYFLTMSAVLSGTVMYELNFRYAILSVIGLAFAAGLFFKIIPTPYLWLAKELPMGIAISVDAIYAFFVIAIPVFLSSKINYFSTPKMPDNSEL